MHWASTLLNKPWVANTRGPDAFDCWGLVHYVYAKQLGIELPSYLYIDACSDHAKSVIDAATRSESWKEVKVPFELAVVAMSVGKRFCHVGLWTEEADGLVIHCSEISGVRASSLHEIKSSYTHVKYFTWHSSQ
jgi:hypothetical protein